MANYYTFFSEALPLKSIEECAWWELYLNTGDSQNWDEEGKPLTPEACKVYAITPSWWFSFDARIKNKGEEGCYILFTSEESGRVDQLAKLVQLFFIEMRPDDCLFTLGWASTCDKMRTGEFGGGAVAVTKDSITYSSTWEWIADQVEEFDNKESLCILMPSAPIDPTIPA